MDRLFNEDLALKKHTRLRMLPPVPSTGWQPPGGFPNLAAASVVAFDTETREPDDFDKSGPGWSRGAGHIVGVSLAARARDGSRGKWYFPVRHEVHPEQNLDPQHVFSFVRSTLSSQVPKVGANLLYDIGWLGEEGVTVNGPLYDVQFAEALLNDRGRVALDFLGYKYTGAGKTTSLLYQWCADAYGGAADDSQRKNIWRAPPSLVGPYAEDDSSLPLDILDKQWPMLTAEGLHDLLRMECDLIPLLVAMRRQGVRVDTEYAVKLHEDITKTIPTLYGKLSHLSGVRIDSVMSAKQLAAVFDSIGLSYPSTEAGNPSFTKAFLKELAHPVADAINEIREHEKILSTFVEGVLLGRNHNGIIHSSLHPLRSDEGGAITGRFASSDPNLQNISTRSELGKKVRAAFVPFLGHVKWKKLDFSQVEYRALAHFAVDGLQATDIQRVIAFWEGQLRIWGGDGSSDSLRMSYVNNPDTDYHKLVQANILNLTGKEIDRRPIKNINFGLLYGQSERMLAYTAGLKKEEAKGVFETYHKGAPYVRTTMAAIGNEVQKFGFIRTLLNRRVRFELWEPKGYGSQGKGIPLPYKSALANYGSNIIRAYGYRGVNYKLQGTGTGDIVKAGMLKAYKEGVFDVTGVPLLQVHDELDHSVKDDSPIQQEAYAHLQHCLTTGVSMRVPLAVDSKDGPNWAKAD